MGRAGLIVGKWTGACMLGCSPHGSGVGPEGEVAGGLETVGVGLLGWASGVGPGEEEDLRERNCPRKRPGPQEGRPGLGCLWLNCTCGKGLTGENFLDHWRSRSGLSRHAQ